jgi:general secretion pathway protein E
MVGEIRDKETATIAIQAALTGHLMLSTLHTNTALGAITRLMDMGIAPYLIASSLIGVLSQRLVRLLCSCKIKEDNKEILEEFEKIAKKPLKNIYKPKGCKECNFTGYKSRIAVGELLIIDDKLKELIAKGANETVLKDFSKNKSLKENLIELITSGKTSIQEAIRVGLKD